MKCFKRIIASLLAVSCMASAAGCKDDHDHKMVDTGDVSDIAQEDMPYGSTMTHLKTTTDETLAMDIEYDNRFLTEEEARTVADSIKALNTCDTKLWEETLPGGYVYYLMSVTSSESVESFLGGRREAIEEAYTGKGFDFNYIMVNSCVGEDENDFSDVDAQLEKAGVKGEITSRKFIGIDMYYTLPDDTSSYSLKAKSGADYYLNVYTIDGEVYVM